MVTTHTAQSPPAHPTDPTAPPLPLQPVLLLATSDGKLRGYVLGDTDRADSCVAPPSLPMPLDAVLKAALTAGPRAALTEPHGQSERSRRPFAAEADADEGEGSTGSSPAQASISPVQRSVDLANAALQQRAQQAALPDSDDDDEASDADSAAVTSSPAAVTSNATLFQFAKNDTQGTTTGPSNQEKEVQPSVPAPAEGRGTGFSFTPKPVTAGLSGEAPPTLPTARMPTPERQPPPVATPPPVQPLPVSTPAAQLSGIHSRMAVD